MSFYICREFSNSIIALYMEVNNYESAIATLLEENQGVLPDLTTYVCVALLSEVPGPPVRMTVAELLAFALAEISADAAEAEPVESSVAVAVGVKVKVPTELQYSGGPVVLADLLERAVVSVN